LDFFEQLIASVLDQARVSGNQSQVAVVQVVGDVGDEKIGQVVVWGKECRGLIETKLPDFGDKVMEMSEACGTTEKKCIKHKE
jgi:hypothetical protein